MHRKHPHHVISICIWDINMSFSKVSIRACGGLMGFGWLSVFWMDLTWTSDSWAWQGRVGSFGLFVCLFWFALLDSLRPSQQSSGLVGIGLPGWIQYKAAGKMSVCFDIFHPSRIGTISYSSVLYQFRCLALRHNTVTLTSVSLELANLQLSHCTPHRHERLRQTLSIITLILLDSLLLINKTRHADNNYLHVWILKEIVSFRRFFWVPRRNTNDFFQNLQTYLA